LVVNKYVRMKDYLKKIKHYQKNRDLGFQYINEKKWEEGILILNDIIIPFLLEEASSQFISKAISNTEDLTAEELNQLPETSKYVHPELYRMYELLCQCYVETKKSTAAMKSCTSALSLQPELTDARIFRARAKMLEEDYDSAYGDLQQVLNVDRNNQQAHNLMQECQRLQKMKKRVDYYNILGVEKTATSAQIKKAYRKLAVTLHPDKVPTDEKEEAEKKMQRVNEAYEILGDDEKRQKYDRGEDLEPQGGGGNPFGGGFNPFGGGFGGFGGFPGGGGGGQWQFHFRQ